MSATEEEVGITSPVGESVASDEWELAIIDVVSERNVVPTLQLVLDLDVVVREGEACVGRALDEVEASDSRTEEASEGDSFVDIIGKLENETGGESEGFTFADILQRADLLSETVLEGVVDTPLLICHCVSAHSSYSFSFYLRGNMVAIHILHKLVLSARLFMKMASWGFVF